MSDGRRVYRSGRREEQARLTRGRVLDAATATFLDRGFAGATVRMIAAAAGVSVPTVELLFGTKVKLLKAAIDVAIAGDDEPVAVLDRGWAREASRVDGADEFLAIVAKVIVAAQRRSAGLVLAAFEAARYDGELAGLADQLTAQRVATATWIVDQVARRAPPRADLPRREAIDTVWILMDPAMFDRLTRARGWTPARYRRWFAGSVARLLIGDPKTPRRRST